MQVLSLLTTEWDNPKETEDTKGYLRLAEEMAEKLRGIKGKTDKEIFAAQARE